MPIRTYRVSKGAIGSDQLKSSFGKQVSIALAGGVTNAISFAWQNPENSKIIVDRVILRITAAGLATSLMDIGVVADATSTADTLIDGVAISATGIFDNVQDKGTNGKPRQVVDEKDGTNDYITGKILIADAADLAGTVYIHYRVV